MKNLLVIKFAVITLAPLQAQMGQGHGLIGQRPPGYAVWIL